MRFLFVLFVVMPIAEMWLLIKVGGHIGALNTIGLVVLTAFVGITLLRQQGLSTLWRAQERMDSGELPAQEIVEGLLLAVGGALLLTPGFITDTVGFACLLPGLRHWLIARMVRHFTVIQAQRYSAQQAHRGRDGSRGYTIEGDFRRHDQNDD